MIDRPHLSKKVLKALLGVELKSETNEAPAKHDPLKIDADPTRAPSIPIVPSAHHHALQVSQTPLTDGFFVSLTLG